MNKNVATPKDPGTVTCDNCGFRYGAEHTVSRQDEPERYDCPVCSETQLEGVVAELRSTLARYEAG